MSELKRYKSVNVTGNWRHELYEDVYLCSEADPVLTALRAENEALKGAIAVYCREEQGHVDFDGDAHAVKWFMDWMRLYEKSLPEIKEVSDEGELMAESAHTLGYIPDEVGDD